ncbi:hypothetical protein L1987_67395 [Smallanthus sonchifolius]|uniref:Uncharacterized protein n=1 Tax=Smallanthus sonchifolius TaxID=185202 RepID=A0ACB9B3L3_9ASTR|nr:hypothetical protein L1987_67395 [Smallanthus sonchifolius]
MNRQFHSYKTLFLQNLNPRNSSYGGVLLFNDRSLTMATVAPPAHEAADLLKNLSLNSQTKSLEILEPTKKSSVDTGKGQVLPGNFMDPTMAYFPNGYPSTAYFYGGYDGTTNDWGDYSRYADPSVVDLAHGIYGYGYAPYGPYSPAGSPVPTVGHDGQLYGAQNYQYSSPYFQPLTPTSGQFSATVAYPKGEITTHTAAGQLPLASGANKGIFYGGGIGVGLKESTGPVPMRPTTYENSAFNINGSYGRSSQNGYQDLRYSYDGSLCYGPQVRNNCVASRTQNHLLTPRPMSCVNTTAYGQYGNTCQSGYGYGTNAYDLQNNEFNPRGRPNGFFSYSSGSSDYLNELNRGPRTTTTKNLKPTTPITIAVKGQNITLSPTIKIENKSKEVEEFNVTPDREQYNKTGFPETYADAKFFVIKSYSEDDVHKSIKYNVWASTQNGNKKLDAAFQEAQQKYGSCPVFLFFSVNTSGQFVGVAEMVGPVDFDKSLGYWQQDKWIGCFPVKWHIVKDIPNILLKHIVLEYNEYKPVTNSRDTQEVNVERGLQMIKIFKEHSSKQCILDDFQFYEDRQRKIQEIKAKQQQIRTHAWEGKPVIGEKFKEGRKVEVKKSEDLVNEVKLANSVQDIVAEPAENKMLLNGLALGC